MSERTVHVTVEVTERYRAEYEIDEADYLEWLDGETDSDALVCEYLRAGDTYEVVTSVYDSAKANGATSVECSEIVEATS